jgi:exosortase/archaeosortase family protein
MIEQNTTDTKFKAFVQSYRQEIKFVLIFTIGIIVCFQLIYHPFVANNIIKQITVLETVIAAQILELIGYPNIQSGLFISGGQGNAFRMQVLNTCNGVYESVIFLMAFVAIQVPWRKKIGWMLGGFLFFHFVNEMRLVSLFIVGTHYSADTFVFFHETFWNYAIVLVALGTFIFCAMQVTKAPAPPAKEAEAK